MTQTDKNNLSFAIIGMALFLVGLIIKNQGLAIAGVLSFIYFHNKWRKG